MEKEIETTTKIHPFLPCWALRLQALGLGSLGCQTWDDDIRKLKGTTGGDLGFKVYI